MTTWPSRARTFFPSPLNRLSLSFIHLASDEPSVPMPSILSRFKRSPSTSSSSLPGGDQHHPRRTSTVSSHHSTTTSTEEETALAADSNTTWSPLIGQEGSSFVEQFDEPSDSPSQQGKRRPAPLAIPEPLDKYISGKGTPKLVLTEEGSNSRISLDSSPVKAKRGETGLGLTEPLLGKQAVRFRPSPSFRYL